MIAVLVIPEKLIEHIHPAHAAEGLGGRAEFDEVVRGGGRRAKQAVRAPFHKLGDDFLSLAFEVFNGAGLVANHSVEVRGVEVVQAFVVRDCDILAGLAVNRPFAFDAKLCPFANGLIADRQRRDDQGSPVGFSYHVLRENQLHRRLSQSAIGEDRRLTLE